jgi:hypothetical protein
VSNEQECDRWMQSKQFAHTSSSTSPTREELPASS